MIKVYYLGLIVVIYISVIYLFFRLQNRFQKREQLFIALAAITVVGVISPIFFDDQVLYYYNFFAFFSIPISIVFTPLFLIVTNKISPSLSSKRFFLKVSIVPLAVSASLLTYSDISLLKSNIFWLRFILFSAVFVLLIFLFLTMKKFFLKFINSSNTYELNSFINPFIIYCLVSLIPSITGVISNIYVGAHPTWENALFNNVSLVLSYLTINSIIILIPMTISTFKEIVALNLQSLRQVVGICAINAVIFLLLSQYYGWWVGTQIHEFYPWLIR